MSLLTCNDFLKELSDYLDESVEGELRQRIGGHITECPNCWVMLDTTKKTLQIYRGLEPEPIPTGLHSKLMTALAKKMVSGGPSS